MTRRLPPLNGLRAFEAAARHLSFRDAADELHVTPGAISHQVKALESFLGVALFHRRPRGMELTDAGRAGLPALAGAFDLLGEGVHRMRMQDERKNLTVWMAPSFASKWLVPRLQRFSRRHPEIDLSISASTSLIDAGGHGSAIPAAAFRAHQVDVAIRFGRGVYPGCRVDRLLQANAVSLCSPRLLEGRHPLAQPGDLRHHALLHDDTIYEGRPRWADWLAAAGVKDLDAERGARFNSVSLVLEAAVEGQGVALTLEPLAHADLVAGRLVVPFDLRLPLEHAYYVISQEGEADTPAIGAFRAWLLAEARQDAALAGAG